MSDAHQIYWGGAWRPSAGTEFLPVHESATEELLAEVPAGTAADVDAAVHAAREAFPSWSTTPVAERQAWLRRLADALTAQQDELATLIAREVGMPRVMAKAIQVGLPITVLRSYADLLDHYPFEEEVGNSLVLREPIGVVGAITPWNYPLHQIVAKLAPALAAGACLVLKPSEVAPLNALALAGLCHDIGLPPGVFNLVSGSGPVVGERLAAHPEVDMISFTGSTRAGIRVAQLAATTVKRVAQELGGKSACLILRDADLPRAVRSGVNNAFLNSGQTCSAWTRMLVPREQHDEAVQIAQAVAERFTLGDPLSPATKLGPLVSAAQRDRVLGHITRGIAEGARLVMGSAERPADFPRGYFVAPTIFANVDNAMAIAREEIFGPVLAILPYDDEEAAIAIANDSSYGLGGAVFSQDADHALRVARRLRTGQVDINGGRYNPLAPFGGYKQSGNGREFGVWGLEEYLEVKSLQR